jgi:hypothetical protein
MCATDPLLALLDHHLGGRDGRTLGYGPDPFETSGRSRHQPMAYAMYARGLVKLHRSTGRQQYLDTCAAALDQLGALAGPQGSAWGLGYRWRGQPADRAFTVTTVLCGLAFLEYCEVTSHSFAATQVDRVCAWLTRELPWSPRSSGVAPWYAPGMPFLLPNVASLTSSLLYRWGRVTGDRTLLAAAGLSRRFVEGAQQPEGFWTYGYADVHSRAPTKPSNTVDAIHLSYVLDGLLSLSDRDLYGRLRTGIEFLRRYLFVDGRLLEKVGLVTDGDLPADSIGRHRLSTLTMPSGRRLVVYPREARVGNYGAAIGLLARAADAGLCGHSMLQEALVRRVLNAQSASPTGRFAYLPDDQRWFPRQEGHLFDGLAAVVLSRRAEADARVVAKPY